MRTIAIGKKRAAPERLLGELVTDGATDCHENVRRWVKAHPRHSAIDGWVTLGGNGGTMLTAHSVVGDENGALFDITPINDEYRIRPTMRFIVDAADEQLFFEMLKEGPATLSTALVTKCDRSIAHPA